MRTRNAGIPKSTPTAAAAKKTPPARKSAAKTPDSGSQTVTPKRVSATRSKQAKNNQTTPEPEFAEETTASADPVKSTPVTKQVLGTKTTRAATRKTTPRTKSPASAKSNSRKTSKSCETGKAKIEESTNYEEVVEAKDVEPANIEHTHVAVEEESVKKEEPTSENVEEYSKKEDNSSLVVLEEESSRKEENKSENVEEYPKEEDNSSLMVVEEESARKEEPDSGRVEEYSNKEDSSSLMVVEEESARKEEPCSGRVEEYSNKEDSSSLMVVEKESARKEKPGSGSVEESAEKEDNSSLKAVEEASANKEKPIPEIGEEYSKEEDNSSLMVEEESAKKELPISENVEEYSEKEDNSSIMVEEESARKEKLTSGSAEESSKKEDNSVAFPEESLSKGETANEAEKELPLVADVGNFSKQEYPPVVADVMGSSENEPSKVAKLGEEIKGKEEMVEMKNVEDIVESKNEPVSMEEDTNEESKREADKKEEGNEYSGEGRMEECGDEEVLEKFGEEQLADDNVMEHEEEAEPLEEERVELDAAAKERMIKKELEIFVGGLDRDVMEEDVKKAFENIGDVVEVRLHKNPSTNKNKGYAFVKFATKEQASRALSEMKNPLIRGKRCGTGPTENNDTLFLGNICNTWTNEAIKRKLKDYSIEAVENITLVPDAQREGLSRGFAFLEFSCHADAMIAYKRLQKPDVIFGHTERTAKVAFAEPIREPDPEVMAQVKSVFLDGLPPQWNEDRVREQCKRYGEIERIVLAKNMSSAKRKDFGFVDFTTHEAAIACIDGVNSAELGDGNSKTRVRARLSNPLPKTQAVKGGMCGGFRIGSSGAASSSRFGRGFGRAASSFNRGNFQPGRSFYQHGRGQTGRMGFANDYDLHSQYPPIHGRHMFGQGGRRGSFGTANMVSGRGPAPAGPSADRPWYGAGGRGPGRHIPARRQPVYREEGFNRPFTGRHFDDPYFHDDGARGIKRPFYMTDQDHDYMERSRLRPRMEYSDPAVSGSRYQDTFGATGPYSRDPYGAEYDRGAYFYGGDRPYGGGYYH